MRADDHGPVRGRTSLALLLAAAVAGGGCGDLTAGGATGEVESAVSGDAPEPAEQSSARLFTPDEGSGTASDSRSTATVAATALIEGDVDATLRVYLENDVGERFPVVGNDTRAVVDVQGNAEVGVGDVELDVGSYPRTRIVFTDVHAVIESGLIIGDVTLKGRIDVGDETVDSIVVERDVGIHLEENAEHQLLVDLNSPSWLVLADPVLRIVAADDFASAVEVQVR